MNEQAEIQVEKLKDCLIARLSGPLNASLGEQLLERIRTQLEHSRNVIIDLTGVEYLDSAGMGALVSVQMSTKRKGHNCILTGLQGVPLEVMRSSQLLKIFQVQDSVDAALEQVRESE